MGKRQVGACAVKAALPAQLRTLLIAPRTDLPNADAEVERIVNTLHPEVLFGEVTASDVLDAVNGQKYAVVWFLGHSGPEGIQLSDGVLSPSHLTQIMRGTPPSLVVLNSCSSLSIAMQIHDDLQCAVVCTVLDVADLDAYITGALLAQALGRGLDLPEAYSQSRPALNRQYVLLNGSIRMNGADKIDDTHRLLLRVAADLQRELAAVRAEQTAVRNELATNADKYHAQLTRPHALSWAASLVLVATAAAMIEFRYMLGLSLPAALGFSLFVLLVAFWLSVWGLQFRLDKN